MLGKKEILKNRKIFSETDKRMALIFKVLSDINRYRMFRILLKQPQLSITNIAQILNISLSLASQHLKILTNTNLIQKERKGKKIFAKLEQSSPIVKLVVKTIQQSEKIVK